MSPRNRLLVLTLLAALPLAALHAAPQATPGAKPEAEFRLEPYRKTIALRGSVNGVPGRFLVDTAGGSTVLSPKFVEKIGCKPWGRLTGFRMMGERLDTPRCDNVDIAVGGTTLHLPVAGVLDIAALIASDAEPVEGSIALDAFAGRTITIDFPGKRLLIESPDSLRERIRHARELPASMSREIQGRALAVSLGVPTPEGMVWMEVDSGNGGTLLVSKVYAKYFGLDPDQEGPQQGDFAVSKDFRAQGMAFTPDMILDGNIGMPFLKDKVVTFDLKDGRLWVAQGGQPAQDQAAAAAPAR